MEARTARANGWPFMVMRGRDNDGKVTDVDRMIAVALTLYEDSLCAGCGLPHSKTRGDDNVGRYELRDDQMCHGCEPLEAARRDKNRTSFPGQKLYLAES